MVDTVAGIVGICTAVLLGLPILTFFSLATLAAPWLLSKHGLATFTLWQLTPWLTLIICVALAGIPIAALGFLPIALLLY